MEDAELIQLLTNIGFAGIIAIMLLRYVTVELTKRLDNLTRAIEDLRRTIIEYFSGVKDGNKR